MATPDYIPTKPKDFNDFQNNLNTEVTANATAWNIQATAATELDTRSTNFVPIYNAIKNKETRTPQQMVAYRTYRKEYDSFLRTFCQSFLTNNAIIPIDQRKALGLNPRGLNPPSKRPKIDTPPIPSLTALGGGSMRFSFKVEESSKRFGRHPYSNGVEVYYKLETPTTTVNDSLVVEETTKEGDYNGFDHVFSTRARFEQELGLDKIGMVLTVYARWVNTSDPSKNSTYSTSVSRVVS